MALMAVAGARRRVIHLACCAPRSYSNAGWRIPSGTKETGVEHLSVPVSSDGSTAGICVKQRFTITPGSSARDDCTGTRVWPTAMPLLERILPNLSGRPLQILELGSGCGLLGMALAAAGHEVVLTDHAGNMQWLRENIQLNANVVGDRAASQRLCWGSHEDMASIETILRNDSFDAIVGSDIFYDPNSHRDLVDTLCRFAIPGVTTMYLGYPKRNKIDEAFLEALSHHFDVKTEPLDDENRRVLAVCKIRT